MAVLGFSSEFSNTRVSAAFLLGCSLVLGGCGANGELVNPFEQAAVNDVSSGDENETSDNVAPENQVEEHVLSLVSQPSNATITEGESIEFSVSVDHSHPIIVTWFKDGELIQANSSTSYSATQAGTYTCAVSDGELTEQCSSFSLDLEAVAQGTNVESSDYVTFRMHPGNKIVSEGEYVSLRVHVNTSETPTFQWYFDDAVIAGATNRVLELNNVDEADSGSYKVVVTSGDASVTSNSGSLSVTPVLASVAITWDAPTKRSDGSSLEASEIASYEIHYSATAGGELTLIDTIPAAEVNEYTMSGMDKGIHYFALSTVDKDDLKSQLSQAVAVNIE